MDDVRVELPLILAAIDPEFNADGYVFDEQAKHLPLESESLGEPVLALFTNASLAEQQAKLQGLKTHLLFMDDPQDVVALLVLARRFQKIHWVAIDPTIGPRRTPRIALDELIAVLESLPPAT